MDEVEPPPGWNELSYSEKKEILDKDLDYYWYENKEPINVNSLLLISFYILKKALEIMIFVYGIEGFLERLRYKF